MTDTVQPPPDDYLIALQQLQRIVTDHHVAILKLQDALTYFPCPMGRTTTDVAISDTAAPVAAAARVKPLTAPDKQRPLNVEECMKSGLCNCAAGIATEPLKLGQPDPVP